MARRMSQRHRIERLQAEAAATEREKEEKRKAREKAGLTKKPATRRRAAGESTRSTAGTSSTSGRMKAVWVVCARNGTVASTYPYNQRAAADAEAERLTDKKDSEHYVKADKVPFDS